MVGKTLFTALVICVWCASGSSVGDCNFNKGMCGWTHDKDSDLKWTRKAGARPIYGTQPKGFYMHIETTKETGSAKLISPILNMEKQCEMTLWYSLYGYTFGNFWLWIKNERKRIWLDGRQNTTRTNWYISIRNLQMKGSSLKDYQVILEWESNGKGRRRMSIDDISFGPCTKFSGCDFEQHLCGMTPGESSLRFWKRRQGNTQTANTGPKKDHTTSSGYYMFLESDPPSKEGDTALLYSRVLNSNASTCFSFWYSMFGVQMGSLSVYIYKMHDPFHRSLAVFTATGNHGDKWNYATINLLGHVKKGGYYVLGFEGVVGKGSLSDIAIDDIKITKKCSDHVGCDFEQDLCGMYHADPSSYYWTRKQGNIRNSDTSPSDIDSASTGYFIDTSKIPHAGDFATIESRILKKNKQLCLNFWYHRYGGTTAGKLKVYVRDWVHGARRTIVFETTDNGVNKWLYQSVNLLNYVKSMKKYVIGFEGTRGRTNTDNIEIDDIELTKCSV